MSAGYAFFKVPLDARGVTANTGDPSTDPLIRARLGGSALPPRGGAGVRRRVRVAVYVAAPRGTHRRTCLDVRSPRAVDHFVQRSAAAGGPGRGRGLAPRPARRRSGELNITDAGQSR